MTFRPLAALVCLSLVIGCTTPTPPIPYTTTPILIWNPNKGMVEWITPSNQATPVSPPLGTAQPGARSLLCAEYPQEQAFIVFIGERVGRLFLYRADTASDIGPGSALGCELSGNTVFSADGKTIATLTHDAAAGLGSEYAVGTLRIINSADGKETRTIPDVTAFTLTETGGYAARIGTQAEVITWQGNAPITTIRTVSAREGCALVSMRVLKVVNGFYIGVGEKCANPSGYTATMYHAGPNGENLQPIQAPLTLKGKFYPGANTHVLSLLADGKTALWFVPNGVRFETADIFSFNSTEATPTITRQLSAAFMDSSPALMQRRVAFSPDGKQLALTVINPEGGETLFLWDVTRPESEPEQVNELIRAARVGGVAWGADGKRLAYLRGGSDAGLSYLDGRGERRDALRGEYRQVLLSADGSLAYVVALNGETFDILSIRIADNAQQTLMAGLKRQPTLLIVP